MGNGFERGPGEMLAWISSKDNCFCGWERKIEDKRSNKRVLLGRPRIKEKWDESDEREGEQGNLEEGNSVLG